MWFSCRCAGSASRCPGLVTRPRAAPVAISSSLLKPKLCRHHDSGHVAVRMRLSHKRVLNIQHSTLTEIRKPRHSSAAFNLSPRHQCSPERSPGRPTHRRLTPTRNSRRKRTCSAARSSLYSLSRVRPRPPLSRTSIGRERTGAWPFPEGRQRVRAWRLFRGRVPGMVRAPPACRMLAQSSARSRWRAASSPFGVWLYVAQEWRQNSNE